MKVMRVIVTGSRGWSDTRAVTKALTGLYLDHGPFALVHGACSTGADEIAHHWCEAAGGALGVTEEKFKADWRRLGRAAGPARNIRMVSAGADLVLAFVAPCISPTCPRLGPHGSHGTQSTIDLARQAGIEVRVWSSDE